MKKYILTCLALATVCGASARKPRTARTQESATRDSLRCAAETLLRQVDSLETALLCARAAATVAAEQREPAAPAIDPEQAAADSIATVRERLRPTRIRSTFDTHELTVLDTLATDNDAVQVILYSNNSWRYAINREVMRDESIFEKYWDTTTLFPYREVDMSAMPSSVVIELLDSVTSYHCSSTR